MHTRKLLRRHSLRFCFSCHRAAVIGTPLMHCCCYCMLHEVPQHDHADKTCVQNSPQHTPCAAQAITERSQLLDLTHRACTKRYILYMHKMNKRGNVRAAVDLHCLGLSPCQTQAQPGGTQAYGAAESETEQQVSGDSGSFAAAAGSMASEQRLSLAALGSEAASHLASGTLSGLQLSGDPALQSDVPESPLGTPSARRSSRLGPSRFAPPGSVMPSAMQETDEPPSAGPNSYMQAV